MTQHQTEAQGYETFLKCVAQHRSVNGGAIDRETWAYIAKVCKIDPPPYPTAPKVSVRGRGRGRLPPKKSVLEGGGF